jgi:hypothetical protein
MTRHLWPIAMAEPSSCLLLLLLTISSSAAQSPSSLSNPSTPSVVAPVSVGDTRVLVGTLVGCLVTVAAVMLTVAILEMRAGLWCGVRPYLLMTCCGLCPLRDRAKPPADSTAWARLSGRHAANPGSPHSMPTLSHPGRGPRVAGSQRRVLYDNPTYAHAKSLEQPGGQPLALMTANPSFRMRSEPFHPTASSKMLSDTRARPIIDSPV